MSYSDEDKLRRDLDSMALYVQHLEGQIWEIKRSSNTSFTSREQKQYVNELLSTIKQREATIADLSRSLKVKDLEIEDLKLKIKSLKSNPEINKLRSELQHKDSENEALVEQLSKLRKQRKSLFFFNSDYEFDATSFELRSEVRRLRNNLKSKDNEIASLNIRLRALGAHKSLSKWASDFFTMLFCRLYLAMFLLMLLAGCVEIVKWLFSPWL